MGKVLTSKVRRVTAKRGDGKRGDAAGRASGTQADVLAGDPISDVERAILNSVREDGVAHQRIRARRELAHSLKTNEYRVRQAITRLQRKGYLYARGQSGVYLTDKAVAGARAVAAGADAVLPVAADLAGAVPSLFASPYVPLFKTLRVRIPVQGDLRQIRMWQRALDAFHREFPFVSLEPDFSGALAAGAVDLEFCTPISLHQQHASFRPLDVAVLTQGGYQPGALSEALLAQGRVAGVDGLLGVPVLRSVTVLAANRELLARHGLADEPIVRPGDWFRVGFMLEERSEGRIHGFNYAGFHHHATFYGIDVREQDGRRVFDRARMTRFMDDLNPYIRRRQFSQLGLDEGRFLDRGLGLWCTYLYAQPWMAERLGEATVLLPLPLEPGGFVTEGSFIGTVPFASEQVEEATLLLGFMASEQGQAVLVSENPEWLAAHTAVLARQASGSTFSAGSVHYAYDPRSVYTQVDTKLYDTHLRRMETEVAKFFLGIQGRDETMDRMERV